MKNLYPELRTLGCDAGADGVNVGEEGDVAGHEGVCAGRIEGAELGEDACAGGLGAADEVDCGMATVAREGQEGIETNA